MNPSNLSRNLLVAAATVIVVFAAAAVLDLRNQNFSGFQTAPDNTVTLVRSGSPADVAGMEVGDRVLIDGGIEVTDSKSLARRPRAAIGETREYVVDRSGEEHTLTMTFSGLPGRQMMLRLVGWVTGLCFLGFGLWPYFKRRNRTTTLLAVLGVCFALAFIGPPYFSSYAMRTLLGVLFLPVIIFGFASLLHFLLVFPKPDPWLSKPNSLRILYTPAFLLTVFILFLVIVQPDSTSALQRVTNIVIGVFFLIYFGLSVVVMVRRYVKASRDERRAYGLNVMVACVVLALLVPVIQIAVGVIAPKVVLPGSDFFGLAFILLPLSFAYAVMKAPVTGVEATEVSAAT